jgi:MFS family permease
MPGSSSPLPASPYAIDRGLSAVAAATTLAMMGCLDIVGTLGSGWLSDRYDKRVLLAAYYGLRGLSLLFLPYANTLPKLALFGVVYALDWIATVPPTVGLASDLFGKRSGLILFGWIFFGHQVGAALAAYGGGLLRVWFGTYQVAFTTAGLLALGAAVLVLTIRHGQGRVPTAAPTRRCPLARQGLLPRRSHLRGRADSGIILTVSTLSVPDGSPDSVHHGDRVRRSCRSMLGKVV